MSSSCSGPLVYSLTTTVATRHVGSIGERVGDIGAFVRESLLLLASAILPVGSLSKPVQALVLLLVAVVVVLALVRLRRHGDPALRVWVRWMALGLAAVAAAYFMFLGSHLHPLDPGIDTRINVFAGLAYCVLVYAVVAAGSQLIFGSRPLATGAAIAAIGIGYGVRLAGDEMAWRDAAARQQNMLGLIDRKLPGLPRGSTLLTFGFPCQAAPEVPIFNKSWDLSGALRLQSNDSTLRAYPIYYGVKVRCGRRLMVAGGGDYGTFRIEYGRIFLLDARQREKRVGSSAECTSALRRSVLGQSPGMGQEHISIRGCRHRAAGDDPRLYVEEGRGLQSVLYLPPSFQQDVDAIATRQQRQGLDLALDAGAELVTPHVGGAGRFAVERCDDLPEAVDDAEAALHHRQHLSEVDDDCGRLAPDDDIRMATARVVNLKPSDAGLVPGAAVAIGSGCEVVRGSSLEGAQVPIQRVRNGPVSNRLAAFEQHSTLA